MLISVKVKPGAKTTPHLDQLDDGSYIAFLHARAHDGEANAALLEILSDYFHVPKTSITIKSGHASRHKLIEL